ncbi:hypothetical protein Ssi03_76200 [Sphaerisporangium siamense]|uniref:Uncharacterized protein n=1 Tax=Sphaerisporangium siamense TaxID=795645 RepID=A0A7W7D2U8_9ACTN|nr:hypothetical protein [Sphaerisporangium siamense]MBB4699300.1 hypothetical protein [Sphaerisporangium siamense]GII89630.1 hypothetical protein Ssi03_76200 [Sphaerisporangium siamense]
MTIRPETSEAGLSGIVTLSLYNREGELIEERVAKNLITDAGDLYYATRGIAAVSPSNTADATKVTGMKLGTGTTAAAKSGAGAALVTYKTASNLVFDASCPQVANLGAGLGVNAVYRVTWGAGVATDTALTELVIVNDAATNATSSAANSISRVVFSAINKGASDILVATWNHKFLGA